MIRSRETYTAGMTPHSVSTPYHLPLIVRQREIEEAVPAAAAAAALQSRPPLQGSSTRRRDTAEAVRPPRNHGNGRRRVPEGREMLGKHGGQSANVSPAVGAGLGAEGRLRERRRAAETCVCFLSLLLAARVKTNNVASVPGAFATLNKATPTGRASETMRSLLKADYHDRRLNNGTRA